MNNVHIKISGRTGSGKTSLATLLSAVLKAHGFNVSVLDDDDVLPDDTHLLMCLKALADHGTVVDIVTERERPSRPESHNYFPIQIQYHGEDEIVTINDPDDLRSGQAFIVISTSEDK